MPKAGFNYTFLAVILIDFVLKKDEKYYLQVFFKKCKYIEKAKKELGVLLMTWEFFLMILIKNELKLGVL